jgi:glycosyltransferase involved in cell wall biosynthesis
MDNLIVNCQKVDFEKALGVPHFLFCLCDVLDVHYNLVFWSDSSKQIECLRGMARFDNASYVSEKRDVTGLGDFIEILPHHFQEKTFNSKAITICHDMHVFDISWKYANHQDVQKQYVKNLKDADAIFAHFPRTYYNLERTIGENLHSLFLTESPLLLYKKIYSHVDGKATNMAPGNDVPFFFYPAQRQQHKNHTGLIEATRILMDRGYEFFVKCAGSGFSIEFDRELRSLVEEHGASDRFMFLNRISDEEIVRHYDECAAVVIPSFAEGGAYVALEALAMGKPVCINQIRSAQTHIQMVKGKVFWFDGSHPLAIAESMERVLTGEAKMLYSSNEIARRRIRTMTWEGVADKWGIVIDWLMGRRDRPILGVDKDGWNITYS